MVIFHSYVSLPEGINIAHGLSCCFHRSTVAPVEPQVGGQDFWVTTHRWETYGEVRHGKSSCDSWLKSTISMAMASMGFSLDSLYLSNSDSKYWHIPYANHGAGILTYMTGWFWARANVGVHIPAPWFAYGHGLNQPGWWWLEPWKFMTFPSYWEFHHPNWRSPSFFRGVGIPPSRFQWPWLQELC